MIKKLLLTILLLSLTGCTQKLGVETSAEKVNTVVSDIQKAQEASKRVSGKYKYQAPEIVDGIKRETSEYLKPDGQVGYWITLEKEDETGVYRKVVATGVDKTSLEYDWILIKDKTIKATSTK